MSWLNTLARRWADAKLAKEADELRFKLVNAEATSERLLQQRNEANRLVNQHEATIATLNGVIQRELSGRHEEPEDAS